MWRMPDLTLLIWYVGQQTLQNAYMVGPVISEQNPPGWNTAQVILRGANISSYWANNETKAHCLNCWICFLKLIPATLRSSVSYYLFCFQMLRAPLQAFTPHSPSSERTDHIEIKFRSLTKTHKANSATRAHRIGTTAWLCFSTPPLPHFSIKKKKTKKHNTHLPGSPTASNFIYSRKLTPFGKLPCFFLLTFSNLPPPASFEYTVGQLQGLGKPIIARLRRRKKSFYSTSCHFLFLFPIGFNRGFHIYWAVLSLMFISMCFTPFTPRRKWMKYKLTHSSTTGGMWISQKHHPPTEQPQTAKQLHFPHV